MQSKPSPDAFLCLELLRVASFVLTNSRAAQEAMKCLKGGGSATDAVEAAIVVLENGDITNAGYGSNLSANGTVECDATLVDHFGRSGACGAVPSKCLDRRTTHFRSWPSNLSETFRHQEPHLACEAHP